MLRTLLKYFAYTTGGLLLTGCILAGAGWFYIGSLDLDKEPVANAASLPADLDFVRNKTTESRGRILAVVTSTESMGSSGKNAGYELTELSRAYWVFIANGYAVDIASPLGGKPLMNLDDGLLEADYAFLNDAQAQTKIRNTLALRDVQPENYAAIYFVGGKGTMWDFPGNPDIQRLVRHIYPRGVVGAVCHGPAALIGVTLDNGAPLLTNKRVAGFSNAEELFLIPEAAELFPFLLQDELSRQGATFSEGKMYLNHTVVDGNLVTGQNPWSTWAVAESMIVALGHKPVARAKSDEEISVEVISAYHQHGLEKALALKTASGARGKRLILMHGVVAAMQWKLGEAFDLQTLARN